MMDFWRSLISSVQENAELTVLILLLFGTGVVWGEDRFATHDDLRRSIEPLEHGIYDLRQSNLQQQRRELRSQIAEIHYAIEQNEATDWQRKFLPELESDLADINDALSDLENP